MKHGVLRKNLKAGKLDRCYILYGEEKFLIDYYRREIRTHVMGAEADDFNYHRMDGSEADIDRLRETMDAYPAFAEHSLIELRDFDLFSFTDTNAKKLAELLKDIPEYCCLLFVYDTLEYKADKRKKLLCEAVQSCAKEVECPLQNADDLIKWIQNRFQSEQKKISRTNAEYLLFLAGNQMNSLANEITKLSFFAETDEITHAEIERIVVPAVEAEIFLLTDELAEKHYEAAADLMYRLLQLNTEPIVLTAIIGSQLRKLYAARLVKECGGSAAMLKELINAYSEYLPRQYLKICGNFSIDWYRMAISACCETDYKLKSSASDVPADLLWTLFLKLAVKEK